MIDKKNTDYAENIALFVTTLYRDQPHKWDEKYAEYDAVYRPLVPKLKEKLGNDYDDVMKAFRNGKQEG